MDIPNLEDSPLPILTLWFVSIYTIAYFITFRKWNKKYRAEASSCLMSLAHGNIALVLSLLSIHKSKFEYEFSWPNTPLQKLALDHSIAYFSIDLLHYILFIPSDVLFILHHIATLYVLATCRYLFGSGGVAILGVLALAEATATCQNTWSLVGYRRFDSDRAASVFEFVSPLFYGYYSVVRGILAPLLVYKIVFAFTSDLGCEIPRWGWVSWMVVMVVGIGLSVLWVLHLWLDFFTRGVNREVKKKKLI